MEMKRVARLFILYSKKEVQIRKVAITFLASGGKNKQGQHSALIPINYHQVPITNHEVTVDLPLVCHYFTIDEALVNHYFRGSCY